MSGTWRSLLTGLLFGSAISVPVAAQISPDGTTNTIVSPIDNGIRIDAGDRAGDNLFHSFEQFSVLNGNEAFFNNANDIVNIFSRVTGGDISNIDGLLRANGDANLFIINPAGIVFGEGASLDIGGSFFGSTAESIVFADDVEFSAVDVNQPPLLTINQPSGLSFGNSPGNIAVNGSNLQVNNGKTLALFGGNVTITGGQIVAPGANIELGGLTQAGQISFEQLETIFFPEKTARGDITLTNDAEVNVQAGSKGSITVNARNLELSSTSNLRAGIAPELGSTEAQAGDIFIDATETITISQGSRIRNEVGELISNKLAIGNAGKINITTSNLFLTQGGRVSANNFGRGNSGAITINAAKTISADGEDRIGLSSGIVSRIFGKDNEGSIEKIDITTTNLILTRGGRISTSNFGTGSGGKIYIKAFETIVADGELPKLKLPSGIFSTLTEQGAGNRQEINIVTANLSLTRGGRVDASTLGEGDAGIITINAANAISVEGEDRTGNPSGIVSRVESEAVGSSGEIKLDTTNLSIAKGGVVSTSAFGKGNAGAVSINAAGTISADGELKNGRPSGIFSIVTGTGEGIEGGINISTAKLNLTRGGLISASTLGKGNAGAIAIEALDTISIDGESLDGFGSGIKSIVTQKGTGNSGAIDITTQDLLLTQGGAVDATTFGRGNAGEIDIRASGIIFAAGTGNILAEEEIKDNSGIFSAAGDTAIGNAAGIKIDTNLLSLKNNAEISVQSLGQGNAGDLFIEANSLSLSNDASLFASTPVGTGGNIDLQIADELILRNNSTISAQALEDANGGNLTVDADLIVAFPDRNNDIIANAARGTGGNIDITTNDIFGLAERRSTPPNNTNDIDASSEFGLDGTININELEVNPAEGLEKLPIKVIDVARLVAQNLCQQGRGSEFIVTGKGGIAPSPTQARDGEISEIDLVEPVNLEDNAGRSERRSSAILATSVEEQLLNPLGRFVSTEAKPEIIEAQGWIINDRGILELVAHKTSVDDSPLQPKDNTICYK